MPHKISRTAKLRFAMKITDSIAFGKAIRERRKELHYTQGDLAEFTGLSVSFISELERGKTTAELGKALQLVQILGMDVFIEKRGQK
jgi:HTH-type transcriptional regulator/antitoxin HipB